jgi:hypothetical protein
LWKRCSSVGGNIVAQFVKKMKIVLGKSCSSVCEKDEARFWGKVVAQLVEKIKLGLGKRCSSVCGKDVAQLVEKM